MSIDWWTLGLQTINITVLVWLLAHFLFRPVAAIIAERKAFAGRLLDEAEEAKTAACGMREQADGALREIAANRAAAIHAAAEEAQTEKSAMLSTAQSEIERLRASADAELAHARKAERRAESERARRLAIDIAAKLLNRLPEGARVAGFVEGLAQAVATLPPETRADFGEGALLKVPRPLTAEEDESCRCVLANAFGHPLDLQIEVDPALIAGLELENQHASVRNSFRADLVRIATEFAKHDIDAPR